MTDLMKRWAKWSGSAEEATEEINRVLSDDQISLRTFQNYVSKRVVSRDSATRTTAYGRRQLLEVLAARAMLKSSRAQLEEIALALSSLDEAGLAAIVRNPAPEPLNPAEAMVQQLKGETAPVAFAASTILRSHQPRVLRTPAPRVDAGRKSMFSMPEAVASESLFLAAASADPLSSDIGASSPEARLVWRDGPLEVSLDATLAEGETEAQLRDRAQRLIDTAIAAARSKR